MPDRPNILVVCGRNKRRSRTAEYLFKNDDRLSIRSVGLSPKSARTIKEQDLIWADIVLVMEAGHKARILGTYRALDLPDMEILDIPDEYEYLDEALMELLTEKINGVLEVHYGN